MNRGPEGRSLRGAGRWLGRLFLTGGLGLAALGAFVAVDGWRAFGAKATGERRARMERSPQWRDGAFRNPQPLVNHVLWSLTAYFKASPHTAPAEQLVPVAVDPRRFDVPPASGLRLTWLGHATTLVELDGVRILTDPMWSERASPVSWAGPRRWYAPPISLDQLPAIDAVVISHDHYDHLDMASVVALKDRTTRFIVPLGVGAHLAYWGVSEDKILELDWWEETQVGKVRVVATPARHASGRTLFDQDSKLWAGYAFVGPEHRVFFSGDTGRFPAQKEIGERLGPFDVSMIETGQYHPAWPDWHIGPEQAVLAHQDIRGGVMLPIHWALLTLAYHGWTEPIERVLVAAQQASVPVLTPRPGEAIEPTTSPALARWWPRVPYETAEQTPVISTGMK